MRNIRWTSRLLLAVEKLLELLTGMDVGFHIDVADVGLRRVEGDSEALGDVLDGAAAHEQVLVNCLGNWPRAMLPKPYSCCR